MADSSDRRDSSTASLVEQVLTHAQAGREVIQEFVPLAESLEWELGQEYLRERGNKAYRRACQKFCVRAGRGVYLITE